MLVDRRRQSIISPSHMTSPPQLHASRLLRNLSLCDHFLTSFSTVVRVVIAVNGKFVVREIISYQQESNSWAIHSWSPEIHNCVCLSFFFLFLFSDTSCGIGFLSLVLIARWQSWDSNPYISPLSNINSLVSSPIDQRSSI